MDRYHDMSISEISADGRSRLEECPNENLFASTDFGELYCYPSAERVRFVENESGAIIEKFLYRKRPLGVFFTELQGIGPIDPHGELLNRLLMEQPASRARRTFSSFAAVIECDSAFSARRIVARPNADSRARSPLFPQRG